MSASYTREELVEKLGRPSFEGFLPGDGSAGHIPAERYAKIPEIPLGPDCILAWACPGAVRGAECVAVSPRSPRSPFFEEAAGDRWYVTQTCMHHRATFYVTQLEEVLPPVSEAVPKTMDALLVDRISYLERSGPDWDHLKSLLDSGWEILLVKGDASLQTKFVVVISEMGGETAP